MFDNPGSKLQSLAKVFFFLSSAVSIAAGLIMLFKDSNLYGLMLILLVPFASYLVSLAMVAIGEMHESMDEMQQESFNRKREWILRKMSEEGKVKTAQKSDSRQNQNNMKRPASNQTRVADKSVTQTPMPAKSENIDYAAEYMKNKSGNLIFVHCQNCGKLNRYTKEEIEQKDEISCPVCGFSIEKDKVVIKKEEPDNYE